MVRASLPARPTPAPKVRTDDQKPQCRHEPSRGLGNRGFRSSPIPAALAVATLAVVVASLAVAIASSGINGRRQAHSDREGEREEVRKEGTDNAFEHGSSCYPDGPRTDH